MLDLRYYQAEAVDAVFDYWMENDGNPLVDLATGTGKSLVMATLIQRLITGWPDMRVMVVTHVSELIEQNYLELLGAWPFAPAGIYSAGLGRRNHRSQIIFAGIQTVHNKVKGIGHIDVIMVDECHLIPANSNTMYGRFIADLRELNPDLKILGLTATPYRLDSGRLDEGDDRLFDKVVYTYSIADGVKDGYLTRLSSSPTSLEYSTKGIAKLGGDFKQSAMQAALDKTDVNARAVDEIVSKGADRKSWLCFCSGVEHAEHIRDEIRSREISCEMISGETPKEERRRILEDFKAGRIRALTNNSVLTTGFNHKGVDLIAFMRPTLSLSLYVQMAGRGTRVIYASGMPQETPEERIAAIVAGPKPTCLVLDFARLVDKHGPVDMVQPKAPGKGDGEAPIKICPQDEGGCGEKVHASAKACPGCGFQFPIDESPKITGHAADAPIMASAVEIEKREVRARSFRFHEGKGDKPPSVKVTYMIGMNAINEWVCPQHTGYAKSKADRYWATHGGSRPFPATALEWLERQSELKDTVSIGVRPNGKYWDVISHLPGLFSTPEEEPVQKPKARMTEWMDDDIPF